MTADIKIHWHEETQLIGYGESDSTGAWLKFRVLPADLDRFRGLKGERFYLTVCQISEDDTPAPSAESMAAVKITAPKESKPYGVEASLLYRSGFFYNQTVMAAVGSDAQYLNWLRTQPCCCAEPGHHGEIVAAHVRRVSAGSGTGIKPGYSAVPLCDEHHKLQHQKGESEVGGKEYLDRQRARHLSRWMAQSVFHEPSMGYVSPARLVGWMAGHGMIHYLPSDYRDMVEENH